MSRTDTPPDGEPEFPSDRLRRLLALSGVTALFLAGSAALTATGTLSTTELGLASVLAFPVFVLTGGQLLIELRP